LIRAASHLWPSANRRRRWLSNFLRLPFGLQMLSTAMTVIVLWFIVNGIYQVIRKPSELFFPVSDVLLRTPAETWKSYAPIFRAHATTVMTAELLAALAQVEGSGNPIVRTYWRWTFSPQPFEMYRPASSAVGMYQITDGTFAEARHYCVHDHVVVEDGPWNDVHSCWFNSLYTRTIPTNAVELTSAYLDHDVAQVIARYHITKATLQQKQDLATLIHLCGAGAGSAYAARGLHVTAGQRCGDHDPHVYLDRVNAMKRIFQRLRQGDEGE
jgi:hypothetical protein